MKWSVGRSEANRPRGKKDGRTALFLPFGRCDGVRSKVGRAGLCVPGGARCVSSRVVWRMEGVYSHAPLGQPGGGREARCGHVARETGEGTERRQQAGNVRRGVGMLLLCAMMAGTAKQWQWRARAWSTRPESRDGGAREGRERRGHESGSRAAHGRTAADGGADVVVGPRNGIRAVPFEARGRERVWLPGGPSCPQRLTGGPALRNKREK